MADVEDGPDRAYTVSVVIPTYRRADLLPRSIRSAFSQSLPPVEVIVVDDAADAATSAVVEQLRHEFGAALIYTATQGDVHGASVARNAGAALAQGELLAFLDDDDWWDAEYLRQALDVLSTAGADMVVTPNWMVIDEAQRVFMTPTAQSFETFRPGMTGSNVVVTSEAFDRIGGFDPGMWVMNDVDFFVRARAAQVRIVAAPERLVYLEGRGEGHLSSASERRALGLEHFLEVHRSAMDRATIRLVRRRISVARAASAERMPARIRHRLAVVWYSSFSDYVGTVKRRLGGRRRSY